MIGLLWLAIASAIPSGDPLSQADDMIRVGRYRGAVQIASARLEISPDDSRALGVLGRAQAGLGRCHQALPSLVAARELGGLTAGTALAEGICAVRAGDDSLAAVAFEETLLLEPDQPRALYQLVRVSAALGDQARMDDAYEALDYQRRAPYMQGLAKAWVAFDQGGEVDLAIDEVRQMLPIQSDYSARAEIAVLEARVWLHVGAPELAAQALEVAARGRSTDARFHAWLAESFRVAGVTDRARSLWEGRLISRSQLSEVRLLQARWHVDLGEFAEAERLIELTHGEEPRLRLPTEWYLETARGLDGSALAAAYEGVRRSHDVSLESLAPR